MPKPDNESYVQYRDRTLNSISPTFCGAKGGNATIWLNSGETASCHHPPAHVIPLEEVRKNFRALHNTSHKKQARLEMMNGIRTAECDYCWRAERNGLDVVSDRVFKSVIYSDHYLNVLAKQYRDGSDCVPQTLEIAFDNLCNFACSYCNANFSTTWSKDIKTRGPYIGMHTAGSETFRHAGENADKGVQPDGSNPYQDAFMEWWRKELSRELFEIRITGGEALMSPAFWRFMDHIKHNPTDATLAVNSNLGCAPHLIDRLLDSVKDLPDFQIYTSCEAFGEQAEWVRDGLKWDVWVNNTLRLEEHPAVRHTHCMMTLSAFSVWGLVPFLEWLIEQRKKLNRKYYLQTSFNMLRFPSFQSVIHLPMQDRIDLAGDLKRFVGNVSPRWFNEFEMDSAKRFATALEQEPFNQDSYLAHLRDLATFAEAYALRRNKPTLSKVFPELTKTLQEQGLIDG